jgi:hypothetical protein
MKPLAADTLARPAFAHFLQDLLGLGRIHVVMDQLPLQHFHAGARPQLAIELRQQALGLARRLIAQHFFAENALAAPAFDVAVRGPKGKKGNEKQREEGRTCFSVYSSRASH